MRQLNTSTFPLYFFCFTTILFTYAHSTCLPGSNSCTSCLNSNQCKTCQTGTFLNSTSLCQSCPVGCTACTSAASCSGCTSTFVFSSSGTCSCPQAKGVNYVDNTCTACQVTRCRFCYNDYRVCTYCYGGTGLTSTYDCVPCQIPNCVYCNTNATMCYGGCNKFYGKYNDSSCVPCQDANCAWCETNYKRCRECLSGYGPFNGLCIACNDTNCLKCPLDKNICTQCAAGYNLTDDICSQCTISRCKLCATDASTCTGCILGYGVLNNTCQPCSNINCLNCSASTDICLTCKDISGFGLKNNTCVPCQNTNCDKCVGDATKCTSCKAGYGVYPGTICQQCNSIKPKCLICSTNANSCQVCEDGYGISNGNCVACTSLFCLKCPSNPNICASCATAYGVVTGGGCSPCSVAYCASCSTNVNTCNQCIGGYGLLNGKCFTCTNCLNCSSNNYTCFKCVDKFSLLSNGSCVPCADSNCLQCPINASSCTFCSLGYGVTLFGSCATCNMTSCSNCSINQNVCSQCQFGFGISDGRCFTCTNCIDCSIDFFPCFQCIDRYSLLANGSCSACSDFNCLQCPRNTSSCLICSYGYGVSDSICRLCSSSCLSCFQQNNTACTSCIRGKYLSQMYTCQSCSSYCLQCTNIGHCSTCSDGYYSYFNLYCLPCPQHCSLCTFNSLSSLPQCIECLNSSFYIDDSNPPVCKEVCGDLQAFEYLCDNNLGIAYDGCDDNCLPMDNFTCNINHFTRATICMYHQKIGLSQSGYPLINEDVMNLTISVVVPLYAFAICSSYELATLFSIEDIGIQITYIEFDSQSKEFLLSASISSNFTNNNFTLSFNSSNIKPEFSLLVNEKVNISFPEQFFTPQKQLKKQDSLFSSSINSFSISSYVVTFSAWGSFIFSIAIKSGGMAFQSLTVLQISWLCLSSISPSLLPSQSIDGLKYSGGFNYDFKQIQTRRQLSQQEPSKLVQFFFTDYFNLELLLAAVPITVTLVAYVLLMKFKKNNPCFKVCNQTNSSAQQTQAIEVQNRLFRLVKIYDYGLECLLYFTFNSSIYFSICVGKSMKSSTLDFYQSQNILTLCVLIITILWLIIVFAKFIIRPHSFGAVSFQFRQQKLTQIYPLILSITIIGTVAIFVFLECSWVCLLPTILLIVLIFLKQPFNKKIYNYASIFNLLVLLSFLSLSVYINFSISLHQSLLFAFMFMNMYLLLPLMIILTFSLLFFQLYSHVCKKMSDQEIAFQQKTERKRIQDKLLQLQIISEQVMEASQIVSEIATGYPESTKFIDKILGRKNGKVINIDMDQKDIPAVSAKIGHKKHGSKVKGDKRNVKFNLVCQNSSSNKNEKDSKIRQSKYEEAEQCRSIEAGQNSQVYVIKEKGNIVGFQ